MSMYTDKKKLGGKSSKRHLGHLKLSICEDSSALIVTVHEVRGLRRKENAPNDSYAKIYLLPDPSKQTKEKTRRVKERDPVFNEKFTFILKDHDDLEKRLHISVWNRDRTARNEMVGCMSFLVGDLIGPNKVSLWRNSINVNGWYQLLDETRGLAENVPVPNSLVSMGSQTSLSSTVSAPPSLTKRFAVTLIRGPKGYGFRVTPGTPVYIHNITPGMPAHQSDLQVGDLIIEIDSTDVTKANGDMVANMIKKKRESLQLILQRTTCLMSPTQPLNFTLPLSSSQPYLAHTYTDVVQSPPPTPVEGSNGHARPFSSSRPVFSSQKTLVPALGFQEKRRSSTGGLTQPVEMMYYDMEPVHSHPPQWGRASSRDKVTLSRDRLLPEVPEENSQSSVGGVGMEVGTVRGEGGGVVRGDEASVVGGGVPAQASTARRLSQQDEHVGGFLHSRHSLSQPSFETRSLSPTKLYKGDPNNGGGGVVGGAGGRKYSNNSSLGSPTEEELETGLYGLAMQSYASSKLFPGGPISSVGGLRSAKISSTSVMSNDSAYITESDMLSHHSSCDIRDKSLAMDTAQQHIYPTTPTSLAASHGIGGSGCYSEDTAVEWDSLSKLEQKRQRAINSLIKCEREFCDELSKGIKLYLNPLSSGVISENSHRTIFMNLERMFDLSKYFLSHLSIRCTQWSGVLPPIPFYVECFADIYYTKLDLFKQIFSGYLRNSENSRKEIAVAFTIHDFKKIVQEPMIGDTVPSIYSFVEAGTEYLPKLSRLLVNISHVTPLNHDDHQCLIQVISSLLSILPGSCNDLCHNWMSEIRTMEKLKSTISFGNEVEPFDLMVPPGRVLLHEDEIQIIWRKKKKKTVLLLFSDMLLVTKKSGRGLMTLEPPLLLQDLMVNDINCGQEEFQIVSSNGSYSRLLRASSLQAKNQWMQKLRERVGGSLRTHCKPAGTIKAKDTVRQRELKNELLSERRTPFKAPPLSRLPEDSPIRTLNTSVSPTTGYPVQSQPSGGHFDVLPSKFVVKSDKKEAPDGDSKDKKKQGGGGKSARRESDSPKISRLGMVFGQRRRWSIEHHNLSQEIEGGGVEGGVGGGATNKKKLRRRGESLSQPVFTDNFSFIGLSNREPGGSSGRSKRKSKEEPSLSRVSKAKVQQWAASFDNLLSDPIGVQLFERFLQKECSDENILFWKDCQKFKFTPKEKLQSEAERIFAEYIAHNAPNLVNIDHTVRDEVVSNMSSVNENTFDKASHSIYMLMQRDSYSRFVKIPEFRAALS